MNLTEEVVGAKTHAFPAESDGISWEWTKKTHSSAVLVQNIGVKKMTKGENRYKESGISSKHSNNYIKY